MKIITSGAEFKGFLLQARTTEEAVVGTWSVPEGSASKTLDCPNNSTMVNLCNIQLCHRLSLPAIGRYRILKYKYTILFFFKASITHIDNKEKSSVDLLWMPPLDFQGSIHFVSVIYISNNEPSASQN